MRMRLEIEDVTQRHWDVIDEALKAAENYEFKDGEPRVCLIVEGEDKTDIRHGHLSIERLRALLGFLATANAMAQADQDEARSVEGWDDPADQDDMNTRPDGADQ
jgi:hypothetical protein